MILVEDALRRGQMTVKMPELIIMLGLWGQALILWPSGLLPQWETNISIALGALGWPLALLYNAVAMPKWKLWAYAQVGNPRALKEAAIATRLLPPDNSPFARMAICSAEDKAKIAAFEGRA
ncbi:MAG TPA: hypothetical protein VG839_06450 [Asticcacaulis sp.]|nr:hypothetical protein [Asticcacaulis sp.]